MNLYFLRLGDILMLDGIEYGVEMVNESRARCQPTKRQLKTVVINEKERQINCTVGKRDISISPRIEPGMVIRRMAGAELEKFLGKGHASSTQGQHKPEANAESKEHNMAKTTKTAGATKDRPSYKGRSALIHELAGRNMKPENILAKVKEQWPDTTPKVIADVTASKARGDAAKAAKATAKAAKASKPSKTPPVKAAKAPAKTPPAPKAKAAKVPPAPKAKTPPPAPASTPAPAPVAAEPAAPVAEGFAEPAAA